MMLALLALVACRPSPSSSPTDSGAPADSGQGDGGGATDDGGGGGGGDGGTTGDSGSGDGGGGDSGGGDSGATTLAEWEASVGLSMLRIEPGSFTMGSPDSEPGRMIPKPIHGYQYDREVVHDVTLTRAFHVGQTEVARGLFSALMGFDPSESTTCLTETCPVDTATWSQAALFTNVMSESAGLAACYTCDTAGALPACDGPADPYACEGYRLLTEAEWEYAARAGEVASFQGGGNLLSEDDIESCSPDLLLDNGVLLASLAWYCANADGGSHEPGGYAANAWGLLDTTGNVHEWVNDRYDPLYYDLPEASGDDPVGPATGDQRVRRGGSYAHDPRRLRLAYRGFHDGDDPNAQIGFRIARMDSDG